MVETLGYQRFVTQGVGWGAFVVRSMALQNPEIVRACHHNFVPCGPLPSYKAPLTIGRLMLSPFLYSRAEKEGLGR